MRARGFERNIVKNNWFGCECFSTFVGALQLFSSLSNESMKIFFDYEKSKPKSSRIFMFSLKNKNSTIFIITLKYKK